MKVARRFLRRVLGAHSNHIPWMCEPCDDATSMGRHAGSGVPSGTRGEGVIKPASGTGDLLSMVPPGPYHVHSVTIPALWGCGYDFPSLDTLVEIERFIYTCRLPLHR